MSLLGVSVVSTRGCGKGCAGCAVAHPENPVGVQNTYFAHPALHVSFNKRQLHRKTTSVASILTCFYVEIAFQLPLSRIKHAKLHSQRGTGEPLVVSESEGRLKFGGRLRICIVPQLLKGVSRLEGASDAGGRLRDWVAPQRMEGVSVTRGRLKGWGALQRLEGASKARGRLREWRGLIGWRAPQRLEGASKARGRLREWRGLRGWRAPQRLEGTSETGGYIKGWRAPHRLEDASEAGGRP